MRTPILRPTSHAVWIVLLVVAANAVALFPEVSIGRFPLNDSVLHFTMAERMAQAIERGDNPLAGWIPEWTFGYPVSRTYQPLGHLLAASTYLALLESIPMSTILPWWSYILICLWPLTVYASARLLDMPRRLRSRAV